ncbi:ABC transporter permease [Tellurirhabdus rosea]|uniref:ABC transporter permease n=1 Tax=Tellurirhabdus rosea TaxID=2674997 RepID=UPI00225BC847|nr:ABC transporter permease [Tellurirhabdus rosea]
MLTNYLKIAWRNLVRNKAFSAINIAGLSLGMATCLLILLFVQQELSYDRFHQKADRIVRVVFKASMNGGKIREASVMPPVAQTLKADYPEVLGATRLREAGLPIVTYKDKSFKETGVAFADSNVFDVFTLPLLAGNARTALSQPNTVVISRKTAEKYFGKEDPLGKVLTLRDWKAPFTVTGVMENLPAQSHFHFDLLLSMAGERDAQSGSWMTSGYYTYLLLPEGYDYRQLEVKLPQVAGKYISPQLKQAMGMSLAEFRQKGNDLGLFLQPLTAIHLHSDVLYDFEPGGDIRYLYLFGAIAVFMLLIACINFMNLSTAGASKRGREVGIRKVMGSLKQSLVTQFLLESLLLSGLALVLSLGLVWLMLPYFNQLAGKELTVNVMQNPWLLPGLLLFTVLVSVLAGSYPAFFLSSFKPVSVLKGPGPLAGRAGRKGFSLRSGLVVFQFFISFTLIVGTVVVYRQLQYIQNKKLGYDKEQVLVVRETWRLGQRETGFRERLLEDSRVTNATVSGYLPAGPSNGNNFMAYADNNASQLVKTLRYEVDPYYIPTLGMRMKLGRNFSAAFPTDSSAVIINESAARAFGWGSRALGHTLSRSDNEGRTATYRVIGIVEDFHFKSLHERIAPLVMTLGGNSGSVIVKVKTPEMAGLLADLQKQWAAFGIDAPLEYAFLDESFQATYVAEQQTGTILGVFAGLTILVACLGLFGLATFTAEQRRKEIGVRKVLGASVTGVVALLSRDFLKLVLVAIVIASPVAWYAMNWWLQDFAYKINIEWWVFVVAGLLAVAIALLTVSFQSIKAALMNPVKSLRTE